MAKLDLTGLMTGLPTDQDLRTQGQARAAQIQGRGLGSNLARGIASRAPQREEMMRQGLGGMFGVDTRTGDQQRKARMQQALSGLKLDTPEGLMQLAKIQQSTGDLAGAAQSIAAARSLIEASTVKKQGQTQKKGLATYVANKYGPEEEALVNAGVLTADNIGDFVKGRDSGKTLKGESFKVKDSEGNVFAAVSSFETDTKEAGVSYVNLNSEGPQKPIGAVTPVGGAYSLTGLESIDIAASKAERIEGSKAFAKRKSEAGNAYTAASFALEDANKMMDALKAIRTGGALTAISKEVTDFLGTTPTSVSEFERLAKAKVLAGLKRFGNNPTEGERNFAVQLGENLAKTKGANEAQIQSYIDELTRVKARERYLLGTDITEAAFNEYTLNQWGESNEASSPMVTDGEVIDMSTLPL